MISSRFRCNVKKKIGDAATSHRSSGRFVGIFFLSMSAASGPRPWIPLIGGRWCLKGWNPENNILAISLQCQENLSP